MRTLARIIATPILAFSFGFFWLGFIALMGPMFALFSYLEGEHFSWVEHIDETNEFFMEPLRSIWGCK